MYHRSNRPSRGPCVVSDRVVYRTLLHGGMDRYNEVDKALKAGSTRGRQFQERVWKLIVRFQHMQVDKRTSCALIGNDASDYRSFRRNVKEKLREAPVQKALFAIFPRKVRQIGKDLRLANDFDFFCAGGLDLRDEIELVRMYMEKHFRSLFEIATALRELEFVDDRLRNRLEIFMNRPDEMADVGPYEGFAVNPGTVPRRFWWRYHTPEKD